MRVLMFGWEFPPAKNGGLGVACYGLTKELIKTGVEVVFVLPRSQPVWEGAEFIFADVTKGEAAYPVSDHHAYGSSRSRIAYYDTHTKTWNAQTLLDAVHLFAHKAASIARTQQFDVIHAHDWTSYLAGIAAKVATGKPLIVHVHATSFDQAGGGHADPGMFKVEQEAFQAADQIVVLSQQNRDIIINHHGADPSKIVIVPNGCDPEEPPQHEPALEELKRAGKKIILYHGRITIQKGVDYFVQAAKRVIEVEPNVVFVISGSGDMERQIMQQVGALGISSHVVFAGALWDEERDRMYQSADLLVMPSVSEPFGLVPLEAIKHGTPALVTKQSGVAEIFTHVLKVDFWDVDEMANKMIAAVRYGTLNAQLVKEGRRELWRNAWDKAAQKIRHLYHRLVLVLK